MKHGTKKMKLRTVKDVVEAFGGPAELAKWTGHGMSAICNWVAREIIPPGWHYRMTRWAEEHNYEIDPEIFYRDRHLKRDRDDARA